MTPPRHHHPIPLNAASQHTDPDEHDHDLFLSEELQRHQELAEAMAERRREAELALAAWQKALSHRWSCEVAAQRICLAVQRRLNSLDAAAVASPPFAHTPPEAVGTPRALLEEVRRLELTISLLASHSPFADEAAASLRCVGDELEAAIIQTDRCEAERRSVVGEQRMVARLIEHSNVRARESQARRTLEGE